MADDQGQALDNGPSVDEREESLCNECGHYESDCICWLGEWCDICHEFECCEDTHHAR